MSDPGSFPDQQSILRKPSPKQARADRHEGGRVPWISGVALPSGEPVRLLNISRTGMLIESGSKLAPDSVKELRLCGQETEIVVPASFVRSDISGVSALGVRYQIAVSFDEPLPIDNDQDRESDPATPHADLRAQVTEQIGKVATAANTLPKWIERATDRQLDRLASLLNEVNRIKMMIDGQPPEPPE